MTKTPKSAALLAQLNRDKKRYGVHPCCAKLITGPHSIDCPVMHPVTEHCALWPGEDESYLDDP
jgi:hypothetical protein